ncbi:Conserved oligomeric Golgi complex subunit 6 [Diplonema papillatum]|nr:Conserved oligomeric Golgi complex subunit 6 [Diplonema papillatum]
MSMPAVLAASASSASISRIPSRDALTKSSSLLSRPPGSYSGSSSSQHTTLTRKLKKVLDVPMDDNMRTSLSAISDVYTSDHVAAPERKNLRSVLEARTLELHQAFLADFKTVTEQYRRVAADVSRLCKSCDNMHSALQVTKVASQGMVDQLAVLQSELEETQAKEEQVKMFLQRFYLTQEEKTSLRGEITPQFFTVLEKVKDIHTHCSDLLNAQHQQAGIEVMEMTYLQQSQGYDRLNKWTLQQIPIVMGQDIPDVPSLFMRAINTLKDRPPLWCTCIKEVAKVRRGVLVRRFVTSAGRTGSRHESGHDPLRSVSDVLAWVHQIAAEENDLIDNFFTSHVAKPEGDARTQREVTFEVSRADTLDQTFEGLVKHLRSKIEQTLEVAPPTNEANLVFYFRLESILQFYCCMVPPLIGQNAALTNLLNYLKLTTLKNFFDLLKAMSDRILSCHVTVTADLLPPPIIRDALGKLRVMIDTLADSLIPPEDREKEFSAVLSGIVDPLLTVIEKVDDIDLPSHTILTINTLQLILSTFGEQTFTQTKAMKLNARLEAEVAKFVSIQSEVLLKRSGLAEVVHSIRGNKAAADRQPLSAMSATSPEHVHEAVQSFYKYMYTLSSVAVPMLVDKIHAAKVKEMIGSRATRSICSAYETVYEAVTDPANRYKEPRRMLQHTPDNVRTLLDCS